MLSVCSAWKQFCHQIAFYQWATAQDISQTNGKTCLYHKTHLLSEQLQLATLSVAESRPSGTINALGYK